MIHQYAQKEWRKGIGTFVSHEVVGVCNLMSLSIVTSP